MASRWALVLTVGLGCAGSRPANAPDGLTNGTISDIKDARSKHEATLAAWGRWEDDSTWVTRWCPREPPPGEARFEAFRNYGHWDAKSSDDGPRWATARPGTWLETTTKSGWWIYRQASDEWCWVPGVLDAHIAWRKDFLYAGWAPMPPSERIEDIPDRAWTYTMLGLLHDGWLTTLSAEARTDAMTSTKVGTAPTTDEVAKARADLSRRAKEAGLSAGNDLPPAQTLHDLIMGKPTTGTGASAASQAKKETPIGNPLQGMQGIPGMEGMGALQNLLGDGGMPMMPPLPSGN